MNIRNVAVIGTGILGTQIAIQAACHNYRVASYDLNPTSFARALELLKFRIHNSSRKPTIPWPRMKKGARLVKQCATLEEALREADLVIEAIPEVLGLKRKTFRQLDRLAPPKAILATNSSSIPISRIENATTRPERCLNMHFYAPTMARTSSMSRAGLGPLPASSKRQGNGSVRSAVFR